MCRSKILFHHHMPKLTFHRTSHGEVDNEYLTCLSHFQYGILNIYHHRHSAHLLRIWNLLIILILIAFTLSLRPPHQRHLHHQQDGRVEAEGCDSRAVWRTPRRAGLVPAQDLQHGEAAVRGWDKEMRQFLLIRRQRLPLTFGLPLHCWPNEKVIFQPLTTQFGTRFTRRFVILPSPFPMR